MRINFTLTIATAFILSCFFNESFGQAPNLGTAANFALFTSTGAVTNTGNSIITGNVGSNSSVATGFGNVNGQMHASDGVTAQAAADLLTAYNLIEGTTATFNHAPLLGNGDTLVAGVYAIAGNTALNGNLYLDAKGDGNAVFIFKIGSPLSTGVASKVVLIHGAQACNVFWKVEGVVSMAQGSVMKGTVIANNAAINMSSGASLDGRALSTTGAVSVNGIAAAMPIGCGTAVLTGPAAPNLGTSVCYTIFSGDGTVTNSGVSTVKGDVGTNVGLTTGFTALLVTGTIHSVPDASTAACAADVATAYTYLNGLTDDIELLFPAQFGSGLILTPHTYHMSTGTTLTDTVFLNAEGNANAVFVIKINGAFNTTTNAQVVLTNGAQAKNVYWKVDGAVDIAVLSTFTGTLIANNAAVNLKTGVTLNGRAFTTNGAVLTASVTATEPGGCSALPVTWLYFRGTPTHGSVLLEWATTADVNNNFFTIEKSPDGVTYQTLTTVNATTTAQREYDYSFMDLQPYIVTYYKVSQTDKDGRRSYFNTIAVKMNAGQNFTVSYHVTDYIYIQTLGAKPGNGLIELYSTDGKRMSSQKVILTNEASTFKLPKPLQKGVYLLHLEGNGNKPYNVKVMVY